MLQQSGGTCWLYTILNSLILSKYGRRLVLKKMRQFYQRLPAYKKILFTITSNIGMYGYGNDEYAIFKFIYDFWTSNVSKTAKSPQLMQCLKINISKHTTGSHMYDERPGIYKVLGIKPIDILDMPTLSEPFVLPTKMKNTYELDHASLVLYDVMLPYSSAAHAISCIRTPENVYKIIDSHGKTFECDWRKSDVLWAKLKQQYPTITSFKMEHVSYVWTEKLPVFNTTLKLPPSPINNVKSSPVKRVSPHNNSNGKKNYKSVQVNSKGRTIHIGPRGGKYVLGTTGKKIYKFKVK